MESFLPSEIARLVFGYLEEEECQEAAIALLEKSSHLKECLLATNRGRKFNTKIYGLNLIELLDLLSEAISFASEHRKELRDESKPYHLLNAFLQENLSSGTHHPLTVSGGGLLKNNDPEANLTYSSANPHQNVEGLGSCTNLNSSQKDNDVASVKVKEECIEEEECAAMETGLQALEPQVEISASSPMVVGSPQLLCQPYLQVLYSPAGPTIYCPPPPPLFQAPPPPLLSSSSSSSSADSSSGLENSSSSATSENSYAYPTTVTASSGSTAQPVWSKPTSSQEQPQNNQTTVRTSSSSSVQSVWSKPTSSPELLRNILGCSKLRPIAPKLTQPFENEVTLENGIKVQVMQTKENPLVESTISRRNLRSQKKKKLALPKNHSSSTLLLYNKK